MHAYFFWFLGAAMALVIESLSRRAYFLALSIALLVGGLVDLLGGDILLQGLFALMAGALDLYILRHRLGRSQTELSAQFAPEEDDTPVHVSHWNHDDTTTVTHRGQSWKAVTAPGVKARTGNYFIKGRSRDQLVLANDRRRATRIGRPPGHN